MNFITLYFRFVTIVAFVVAFTNAKGSSPLESNGNSEYTWGSSLEGSVEVIEDLNIEIGPYWHEVRWTGDGVHDYIVVVSSDLIDWELVSSFKAHEGKLRVNRYFYKDDFPSRSFYRVLKVLKE